MHTFYLEKIKYVNQLIFIRYRKYEICRLNRVYFKDVIELLCSDLILNTNLAYIHLLKHVIPLLHISLHWNYSIGGSKLEDERDFGEETCCRTCCCKQGVDVFLPRLLAPLL